MVKILTLKEIIRYREMRLLKVGINFINNNKNSIMEISIRLVLITLIMRIGCLNRVTYSKIIHHITQLTQNYTHTKCKSKQLL
jgi:hypothetical protein